ncbi:MAG: hypothetical protein AAF772_12680, partial [Acidobacteriota bacterium]
AVGGALWTTSLVLVAGFLVLSLSSFEMNAGMGRLTALTIVLALATDFLLLPTLLSKLDRGTTAAPTPSQAPSAAAAGG